MPVRHEMLQARFWGKRRRSRLGVYLSSSPMPFGAPDRYIWHALAVMTHQQMIGILFIIVSAVIAVIAPRIRDANEELQGVVGYRRAKNHWFRHHLIQRLAAAPPFAVGVYLLMSDR